ncbi:hypothetical protein KL912_005276 [Ogataea haglerorum]|nr:hypothetical protein KL912_005276 [Ogataea haglerorum]
MAKDKKKEVVTQDPRFAKVYSDPKFRLPKRKDLKVAVDERFTKEELKLGKKRKLDKYGRKIKEDKKDDFDKFYKREGEQSEEEESESESKSESELSESASHILDRARGLVSEESSSDESDSEDGSELVSEGDSEEIQLEDEPPEGEPTSTFAVVNLDWDHINSADLFATFMGFVPKGGKILSVSIYPSEYGKQRMQQEQIEGPPKELFKSKKVESDSDDEEDLDLAKAAKKLYTEDDGIDYNSKALRLYQLQRLRYYYAIVRCDSVQTSRAIYENCDGTEYESTANHFDLRYVPEDMTFDDAPRDECTKVPSNYKPNSFTTDALQHSKVKLTWDETPAERLAMASRAFSQKEIDDMDFKAYLASDSEESDKEAVSKYKSLVSEVLEKKDENDVDMEITFTPGLAGQEEEKENEETTIDKIKRKEKERRKKRKEKLKELKKAAEEEKKERKKAGKAQKQDLDEKKKAELELLMMDEDKGPEHEHFDMKQMLKEEKKKRKDKKNKSSAQQSEETANSVDIDDNDDRFNEIFEDHAFAIDPTHSEFKRTATMEKLMKKRKAKEPREKNEKLGDLVRKIKRRK